MRKVYYLLIMAVVLPIFANAQSVSGTSPKYKMEIFKAATKENEEKIYNIAKKTKNADRYIIYFENFFPNGYYLKKAQKHGDEIIYNYAIEEDDYGKLLKYKKWFPKGIYQNRIDDDLNRMANNHLSKIIDSEDIHELENFIQTHIGATMQIGKAEKRIALEHKREFETVLASNSLRKKYSFIKRFPESIYFQQVVENIWESVIKKNTITTYSDFIKNTPTNEHHQMAQQKIYELEFENVKRKNSIPEYEAFVKHKTDNPYLNDVKALLDKLLKKDKLLFQSAKTSNTHTSYNNYIKNNPNGKFIDEAKKLIKELPIVTNINAVANGNKIDIHFSVYIENEKKRSRYLKSIYNSKGIVMNHVSGDIIRYDKTGEYVITWDVLKDTKTLEGNVVFYIDLYEVPGFIDKYNGRFYGTIQIGDQVWMAENLNLDVGNGCTCYEYKQANCNKYGRLYTWEAAKRAANKIAGWHLPTDAEWEKLENYLGGRDVAGNKLKSTSGWKNSGNGSNSSGFSALPGGYRDRYGDFDNMGYKAYFWTAPTSSSSIARRRRLDYDDSEVNRDYYGKDNDYSVRLVRD